MFFFWSSFVFHLIELWCSLFNINIIFCSLSTARVGPDWLDNWRYTLLGSVPTVLSLPTIVAHLSSPTVPYYSQCFHIWSQTVRQVKIFSVAIDPLVDIMMVNTINKGISIWIGVIDIYLQSACVSHHSETPSYTAWTGLKYWCQHI